MNTEITEHNKGWVFYDEECGVCRASAERWHSPLARRGFHLVSRQSRWAQQRLGGLGDRPMTEILLLKPEGSLIGGADVLTEIAGFVWFLRPLSLLARFPGARILLRAVYRKLAANRRCLDGVCKVRAGRCHQRTRKNITTAFYHLP